MTESYFLINIQGEKKLKEIDQIYINSEKPEYYSLNVISFL